MVVNAEIETLLKRFDVYAGAKLDRMACPFHGIDSFSFVLQNPDNIGYNELCIACIAELHRELAEGVDINLRALRLAHNCSCHIGSCTELCSVNHHGSCKGDKKK